MELAKSLLVMTDKSITQIGKRAGYSERWYFTRVFYKYTGMAPTEYRDKHMEISERRDHHHAST
ncbi:helix-turn-helix domain-containing protein [Paenibacillus larvae]